MDARLARDGGPPVRTRPWPPRRQIGAEEKQAVNDVLDAAIAGGGAIGYQGEQEDHYCREFARMMGGGLADAVASGTAALYVALRALELPVGSEVVIGPMTDPGGMMPIHLAGYTPIISDCAVDSYNTAAREIEAALSERVRAVVVTHNGGDPAAMAPILSLAQQHELKVIEDCSQAHGATLDGRPVGTFGDVAVFSTGHFKQHCTGALGGVVFTHDEALYWRSRRLADRGKPFALEQASGNAVASFNFNQDELSCAIGRVQLRKLPAIVEHRRASVAALRRALADRGVHSVAIADAIPGASPSYYFVRLRVALSRLSCSKEDFCAALAAEGIPVISNYAQKHMPHRQPWFRTIADPGRSAACPNADETLAACFNLGVHEGWGRPEIDDTAAALSKLDGAFLR